MIGHENTISASAQALRDSFDRSFAHPPAATGDAFEGVLTIRVCGDTYAVALNEVHGLFVDRRVVQLPGRSSESVGITCLRTGIVPVYSLRAFLGYPGVDTPARWLILAGEGKPVAFAFERFEAYARMPRSELISAPVSGRESHIQGAVTIGGERRSIISLHSILHSISARL